MAIVTLTFDNGPDAEVTPRVLDVLAARGLPACFFVVGNRLVDPGAQHAFARARAEGHAFGNHSFTHTTPLGADPRPDAVELEIVATEHRLAELGAPTRLFRPFGGGGVLGPHLLSPAARAYLEAQRYTCVLWNCVPLDWLDEDGWPATALAQCAAQEHAVLVLHDIYAGAMRHLDRVCGELADAGHTFSGSFPDSCLPLVDGAPRAALDAVTASAPGA